MGPIAVGVIVAGVHLVALLVTLLVVLLAGTAPTFRRIYAGSEGTDVPRPSAHCTVSRMG